MAIRTSCPKCRAAYTVPDEQLGRKVRCKQCQEVFTVAALAVPIETPPAPAPSEPPVVEAVAPVHRPPPRRLPRRRRQEAESSGAGALALAIVVIVGSLLVIAGAGAFIWYGFIRQEEKPPEYSGPTNLGPFFPNGSGGPDGDDDDGPNGSPEAAERMAFEPKQFDQPEAGPRTFYPEAPIRRIEEGDMPAPALGRDGSLDAEVLKRVKAATVYLRVTTTDGGGDGTGFFAMAPGLIVTNAHVVGMMNANSPAPTRIDVTVYSGEGNEQTLQGQLLAVDRFADLALVRVKADDLPRPLLVETSQVLRETQPVFVSGFPGGSQRGRNVAVTPTHVDSLLKEDGRLNRVQVRQAMLPGNSGGPVVDPRGHVIGVSVALMRETVTGDTSVNFAVPADKVHHLLNGKVSEFTVGYPHRDGNNLKAEVRMRLFDPWKRTRRAALAWWIGDPGPVRPPSWSKPEPLPDGMKRTLVSLRAGTDSLQAQLILPPLPEGKVYWLQPVLYGASEEHTQWYSAESYVPPPALEGKPALLAKKAQSSDLTIDLTTKALFNMRYRGGGFDLGVNVGSKLVETSSPTGGERRYEDFDIGVRLNGSPVPRYVLRAMMQFRSSVPLPPGQDQFGQVPAKSRRELAALNDPLSTTLVGLDVPLPGKEVPPQHTWTELRTLSLDHLLDQPITQQFQVTYTYRGMRQRDGRSEAIISFDGKSTEQALAVGTLTGIAWVDLASGQTTLVRSTLRYDQQAYMGMMRTELASVGGKVEFRVQRRIK
jgi:predicted Zn finger-like uncharacterized protein